MSDDETVLAALAQQVEWCRRLGSPFTATVIGILADDIADGGQAASLVAGWPGEPVADALALRLAGALHALALTGASPGLVACYAAAAQMTDASALRAAVRSATAEHGAWIQDFIASPPQTNEVGRSAVLIGGFLRVAEATALPLHLLEIGASAGLNQNVDRFRYRLGTADWGDPASRVVLAPAWTGAAPATDAALRIAMRRACDIAPVDLENAEQRLRLRAFVWPDQTARLQRLDGAIAIARQAGTAVERADGADWVAGRLAGRPPGHATVLFHSIMWHYMPAATRDAITEAMQRAGVAAGTTAPLAWLRFEPPDPSSRPELRLTLWPGGREQRLAIAHAHGSDVTWLPREREP